MESGLMRTHGRPSVFRRWPIQAGMKVAGAVGVLTVGLSAARPVQLPGNTQVPQFKAHADAVRVDVLVIRGGRPILGLDREDFRVTDNGIPQRVEVVSTESIPVDIVAVYDTSGSVSGDTLVRLQGALLKVVEQLRPQDHAALVSFSDTVAVTVDFTADRELFSKQLAALRAGGRTRLRDGVFAALALDADQTRRTLVIVLSDGQDTGSWLDGGTLLELCDRTDATVYVVLMGPEDAPNGDRDLLADIARRTGGRTVEARSPEVVGRVFQQVLSEFNSRYVLSYFPQPPSRGWHGIQVSLSGTDKRTVVARRGYWLE